MALEVQTVETLNSQVLPRERASGAVKYIGVAKLPLCHLMTASALTAYVVRRPALELAALEAALCLFLLCLGAATLNNYQDREIDTRLRRTRRRALPLGEISAPAVLVQAALLPAEGLLHATNTGSTTWCGLARLVFELAGADPARVLPTPTEAFPRPAPRPAYSVLDPSSWTSAGLTPLPPWQDSVRACVRGLLAA